ncbi:MAG: hypothetical protein QNK82_09525 [Akkermansiaceae bacterium]|jgi:hypothetical protein
MPSLIDIPALALFYKSLHDHGVDFTSLKLYRRPLNNEERIRNLSRPLSYQDDLAAMKKAGLPDLKQTYEALQSPQ